MRLQRRITTAGWRRTRYSSRRFVVGAKSGKTYSAATLSAFGEDLTHHCPPPPTFSTYSSFFTGKPAVAGLGHAFLMRNYRAGLGKWQTADPMGYPDGWNQLAYCGNGVTGAVDLWGCAKWVLYNWDDWYDYGVKDPTKLTVKKTTQNFTADMDELAFLSDQGLVFRVSHGQTNVGDVKINSTVPRVTFDDDCKHEDWDSWSERCDTTAYYVEVLTDSTVKTVTEMLSIVSGAFSAIGKLGKVVRVGGKVVDTASDVGTDSGLAALLGELFDEHKVLFTIELGIKTEYLQTARQHHLRSYVKE